MELCESKSTILWGWFGHRRARLRNFNTNRLEGKKTLNDSERKHSDNDAHFHFVFQIYSTYSSSTTITLRHAYLLWSLDRGDLMNRTKDGQQLFAMA